jgi:glycosyltransferase involved in cell wall biosynthesis
MGTGIATYARSLAVAARAVGYGADALTSGKVKLDPRNPVLSEVNLYDSRSRSLPFIGDPAILHGIIRAPFGLRPDLLTRTGMVLDRQPGAAAFDRTWIARHLFVGAQAHYRVYNKRVRITLATPPALFHATQPLPLLVKGCPNIVTIHDLVPLRLPYFTLDNKRYVFNLLSELCRGADHIVTVSEHSKRDIMQFFGVPESRITNTWQASMLPPRLLAQPADEAARDVANLFKLDPGGYFLSLGALEPKKNVLRLIDAYVTSGSARPLVIAGGTGWQNENELSRIGDDRFSSYQVTGETIAPYKQVRRITYLPLEQLVPLIRGARALLFPSLYEGFGLPVLEAMMLGTPVMTSNVTSLPQVAGDAALCVDPYDVSAMAEAIRVLDADSDLCAELTRKGLARAGFFSMERYGERLSELYGGILGGTAS